jgi:hypothetical protein
MPFGNVLPFGVQVTVPPPGGGGPHSFAASAGDGAAA